MKKVLLIGGAGYVGIPVAEHFVNLGASVTIVDNFIYGHRKSFLGMLDKEGIEFLNLDMASATDVKRIVELFVESDAVVVLAGLVGDPITKKYPEQSAVINDTAMKNLMDELVSAADGQHIIFVSTCSNYGLMPEGVLANEESDLHPLSLYAEAKVDNEKYILSKADEQCAVTVLRFATAFGLSPRMRFDLTVNQFARSMAVGEELVVFDADTWRPYCHVKDFARLIENVFNSDRSLVNGQVFNAGGDVNNYTKRSLVEMIRSKLPEAKVEYRDHGGDPRNYRVSFEKVRTVLGFEPLYTVEYGVEQVVDAVEKGFFTDDVENNDFGNYTIN